MDKFIAWLAEGGEVLLPWQATVAAQIVDRGAASGKRFLVRRLAGFYGFTDASATAERERVARRCEYLALCRHDFDTAADIRRDFGLEEERGA